MRTGIYDAASIVRTPECALDARYGQGEAARTLRGADAHGHPLHEQRDNLRSALHSAPLSTAGITTTRGQQIARQMLA